MITASFTFLLFTAYDAVAGSLMYLGYLSQEEKKANERVILGAGTTQQNLPGDGKVYQFQIGKPIPGNKNPTFQNSPRPVDEGYVSCVYGPACGNDPKQGLQNSMGRLPRDGDYYRETTIDQLNGAAGEIIFDGTPGNPSHLSVGSIYDPFYFDSIWGPPIELWIP